MIVLDTSALIRFFTNDIPHQAEKVKKIIETGKRIKIPDVVFPEIEYVLLGKTSMFPKKLKWRLFSTKRAI